MVLFIGHTEKFLLYFSLPCPNGNLNGKKREREREKERKWVKNTNCVNIHLVDWVIDDCGRIKKYLCEVQVLARTPNTQLGFHSIFAELHSLCYLFKLTKRQQICYYINDSGSKTTLYTKSMRNHFESETISDEIIKGVSGIKTTHT